MGQAFLQGIFIARLLKGVTNRNINHVDLLMVIYYRWLGTSVKNIQLNYHIPNDKVITQFLHLMIALAIARNDLPKITGE